jgi:hypothetical protein
MKQQINEIKKMQRIAGVINETQNYNLIAKAKQLFPSLQIDANSIYLNDKMLFSSNNDKVIEAFIFGMLVGKTAK